MQGISHFGGYQFFCCPHKKVSIRLSLRPIEQKYGLLLKLDTDQSKFGDTRIWIQHCSVIRHF